MATEYFYRKHLWFVCFALFVLFVFLAFRPLNSPAYRIIVADGLGYYVYLPAQFIYDDKNLEFAWFDQVYYKYYQNPAFEKPTQNFLVQYQNKMINLYYPGQSFLQLPFFFVGHVIAKISNVAADGFSMPYQVAMALSALFYTLLGIFFCHKLVFNTTNNIRLSVLVPLIIFFSTNLFTYSIFNGCYTHCYSFAFISLTLYFSERFFNSDDHKFRNLLLIGLFALIVITLRPMNCILLIAAFYFYKPVSLKQIFSGEKRSLFYGAILLFIVASIAYSVKIIHTQTGQWLANTYTIGRFYFNNWQHVWDNYFGFQTGILWYTPIILMCLLPLVFCFKQPKILFLILPVVLSIILYSLWWYWNIVSRTLVDFSGILVVLLALFLHSLQKSKKIYKYVLASALLCIPFFQLKAYQLRNGILDSNYTYWRYYVKHFFKLSMVHVFPVNPKAVLNEQAYFFDFEDVSVSSNKKFEGNRAEVLNAGIVYAAAKTFTIPTFFWEAGFKKVKTSFWFYRSEQIKNIHLVFTFNRNDSTLVYAPFYINETTAHDKWEFMEFGMDFPANITADCNFKLYFWNPDKQNEAFIDNLKVEFFRTDGSDEVTPLTN